MHETVDDFRDKLERDIELADGLRSELEHELEWREEEMALFKNQLENIDESKREIYRKGLIQLLYSHWEGFTKKAFLLYIGYVNELSITCGEASYMLAATSLDGDFKRYEDPNAKDKDFPKEESHLHRIFRRRRLLENLESITSKKLKIPDSVIDTKSNLKYKVLSRLCYSCGLQKDLFKDIEDKIDKLVNMRNNYAHGANSKGVDEETLNDLYDKVKMAEGKLIIRLSDCLRDRKYLKMSIVHTKHLVLRQWNEADAADLYKYAKDPEVGPAAGWPPHGSVEESRNIIRLVLSGPESYAVCKREDGRVIGAIALSMNGDSRLAEEEDACELGYWIGKPFWGQGLMTEASEALLRRAFTELGMRRVWCGYYEGNEKSKRVQEKLGFRYEKTVREVGVPLLKEVRIEHVSLLSREAWLQKNM